MTLLVLHGRQNRMRPDLAALVSSVEFLDRPDTAIGLVAESSADDVILWDAGIRGGETIGDREHKEPTSLQAKAGRDDKRESHGVALPISVYASSLPRQSSSLSAWVFTGGACFSAPAGLFYA